MSADTPQAAGEGALTSASPAEPTTPQLAPEVIVRDGTTTSAEDAEAARIRDEAARRNAYVEGQFAQAEARAPGQVGYVGRYQMQQDMSPRLLLNYLNADKTVRQQAICEVTVVPGAGGADLSVDPELAFFVPCPRCVARGVPHSHAQMKISSNHRKWWLDTRKARMERVEFTTPLGTPGYAMLNVAGNVTCNDIIRCSARGCGYSVRIDDSNVVEV